MNGIEMVGLAPWEPLDAEFNFDERLYILQEELREYRKQTLKPRPKNFLKRVDQEIRTDTLRKSLLERLDNGADVEAGPLTIAIEEARRSRPRRLIVDKDSCVPEHRTK